MKKKKPQADGGKKSRPMRAWACVALAFAVLAACYLLFGASLRGMLRRRQLRGLNVILITLDTLRADHLGCYDGRFVKTPSLDGLAADGTLFEQCIAQTPLTLPSHTTILSGTYPFYHQVRDNRTTRVPAGLPLISEIFHGRGFATSAFIGAMVLDSSFGLDRGFDLYADRFDMHNPLNFWGEIRKPAAAVLGESRLWIEQQHGRRFFSWIHLYDPHAPWDPPSPFREQYPGHPYRATVAWLDSELGKFFAFLKQAKLWDKTMIMVVADHGEGLGDHGEETHGFFIYQATLRVPFLVRLPFALPHKRLTQRVELTDVAPTILQAMGFETPAAMQGHSLLTLLLGGGGQRPDSAYSETYYPRIHFGWSELKAFYQGNMKYILAPREELYDLALDPGETRNLAGPHPDEARAFRARLNRLLFSSPGPALAADIPRLDYGTREKLASLGYLTASVKDAPGLLAIDPKEKVGVIEKLRLAKDLAAQGRWDEAGRIARDILRSDPQIGQARIASANAYRAAGDFKRAGDELRAGLAYQGDDDQLLALLGETLSVQGRFSEALAAFAGCVTINPRNPANSNNLGLAYWNLGDIPKAEAAFRRALELDGQFALAHANLGRLYLNERRDYPRAKESLLAAVAIDPLLVPAHDALAGYYARAGALAKAGEHWARCLDIEPMNYDACFNLFMLYAKKLHDRPKAMAYYERIRRDFYARLPQAERESIETIRKGLD